MKAILPVLLAGLIACPAVSAIPVGFFSDIDSYLERTEHIVIAKCVSVPENSPHGFIDGFYPAHVEVLKSLKGSKPPGALKIATIYGMEPDRRYLLASGGGQAYDTDFLSTSELSVLPIPDNFDLKLLEGKTSKQQVQMLFARRLYEIERQLAPLLKKKAALDRAVVGRDDNLYESKKKISIGEIKELSTTNRNSILALDLDGVPLQWSVQSPGQSGYFYFSDHLKETPDWEFSAWGEDELEAFDGKKLTARFYGLHSPSRDPDLGQAWGNAIHTKVGQIVFARTVTKPETIYAIKIHKQAERVESLTVKYFVWKD